MSDTLSVACVAGATVAIRNKFSASQFWDDCRKYDVTVIQYIGEIMRYLCNTPKVTATLQLLHQLNLPTLTQRLFPSPKQKPNEHVHKVRMAIGNGIRPEIWREFVRRFGNIQIREFYGATEGNFALLNYSNHVGAVGRDNFLHRVTVPIWRLQTDDVAHAGESLKCCVF